MNESLTSYSKKLFGRIHEFKKATNFKFLWTAGGKMHLREMETSGVFKLKTNGEFQDFLESRG